MIREPRSSFIGRHDELGALAQLLRTSRLVTLTGVGGVGKTRLALRAAAESTDDATRTWFVPLESVQDPHRLPLAVVRALPGAPSAVRDPFEAIADALGAHDGLLVLDNCEHLIDAAATFTDALLEALPGLRVLATSRRPLDLDGEHIFPVPPLSVDANGGKASDAVALLVARAQAADATFRLTAGQEQEAVELCRSLDGLPLAIELAATRLRSLPLSAVAVRLSSRFTLLQGGPRTAVARQRTLRAVVDWSYELCDEHQRKLWCALSVFQGSFDLAAAVAVAGTGETAVVDDLDELVRQSVVEADRETGRFRMLESIRQYGRDRAFEAGLRPQLLRRHLEHFRAVAAHAHAHGYGADQAQTLGTLRAERAELHLALTTATATDPTAAAEIFADLGQHWTVSGFLPEARGWVPRVLALADVDPSSRMRALATAAWVHLLLGDLDEAAVHLEALERAVSTAETVDDRIVIALHRWRGSLAMFSGDAALACREFTLSIDLAERAGLPEETLLARFQLTTAMTHLGAPDAAEPAEAALRLADASGDTWMRAHALWSLALAAFVAGEPGHARERVHAAMTTERGFDDPVGACLMLELEAWLAADPTPERAAVLLGAADARWRRLGTDISVHGPQMTAHHDRCTAALRERLGDRVYDRCLAEGRAMAPGEAVAFALGETDAGPPTVLSARERDIARRVHRGLSNREIAEELVLSVRTVDTHVQRILTKLDVSSRAQVAVWYESEFVALGRG